MKTEQPILITSILLNITLDPGSILSKGTGIAADGQIATMSNPAIGVLMENVNAEDLEGSYYAPVCTKGIVNVYATGSAITQGKLVFSDDDYGAFYCEGFGDGVPTVFPFGRALDSCGARGIFRVLIL